MITDRERERLEKVDINKEQSLYAQIESLHPLSGLEIFGFDNPFMNAAALVFMRRWAGKFLDHLGDNEKQYDHEIDEVNSVYRIFRRR